MIGLPVNAGGNFKNRASIPLAPCMLSQPSFSSPLMNEDLPAGPQLVFTLNNRFFRHQACYSLLPAKPGGQADRVISLCKYKVVEENALCVHMYSTLYTVLGCHTKWFTPFYEDDHGHTFPETYCKFMNQHLFRIVTLLKFFKKS